MKRTLRRSRTSLAISDAVSLRLNLYALAAGAAGVSLLALVQPSEAEIVFTPAHVTIGSNGSYNLDLNNDGITDFTIAESFPLEAQPDPMDLPLTKFLRVTA